jgi:hypothetical protein
VRAVDAGVAGQVCARVIERVTADATNPASLNHQVAQLLVNKVSESLVKLPVNKVDTWSESLISC